MILAIDTATKWTGLALHDGRTLVAESGWYSSHNQTVELAPAVVQMLNRSARSAADLSAIAVAIGPGSYTGLRIGLGFAKGLSLANQLQLIGVPTLDILASALPRSEGTLVIVAEAGRSRICTNNYIWSVGKGWESAEDPTIETWELLLHRIEGPATIAGEITPAGKRLIRNIKKQLKVVTPASTNRRAGYLAEIGWNRLRRGWTDDPEELKPIYLRDPAGSVSGPKE
jgi:tRNA threonylcarbamoyladenosine biosynthesis protein TsaB